MLQKLSNLSKYEARYDKLKFGPKIGSWLNLTRIGIWGRVYLA